MSLTHLIYTIGVHKQVKFLFVIQLGRQRMSTSFAVTALTLWSRWTELKKVLKRITEQMEQRNKRCSKVLNLLFIQIPYRGVV